MLYRVVRTGEAARTHARVLTKMSKTSKTSKKWPNTRMRRSVCETGPRLTFYAPLRLGASGEWPGRISECARRDLCGSLKNDQQLLPSISLIGLARKPSRRVASRALRFAFMLRTGAMSVPGAGSAAWTCASSHANASAMEIRMSKILTKTQ